MKASRLMQLLRRGSEATYLLRDDFSTDESTPLTSPRTCEPGPGDVTISDPGEDLSISGGSLVHGSDAAWSCAGDAARLGGSRTPGLAIFGETAAAIASGAILFPTGVHHGITGGFTSGEAIKLSSAGVTAIYKENGTEIVLTYVPSYPFWSGIIFRSNGAHFVAEGKRLWVHSVSGNRTVPIAQMYKSCALSSFRTLSLPANGYTEWDADFSTVTDSTVNEASGTLFDCPADFHMRWTLTVDTSQYAWLIFRRSGSADYLACRCTGTDLELYSKGFGEATGVIATAAGILSDGVASQIDIVAEGSSIKIFHDNVLKIDQTVTWGTTVAQAATFHNLVTNDFVAYSHPYPGLPGDANRIIAPQWADTATHTVDCLVYYRGVTIPTANDTTKLRHVSAADCINVTFTADGSFYLQDVTTNRITSGAGTVTDGDDVCVVLDGSYAQVFVNGVSIGSTSAISTALAGTQFYHLAPNDGLAFDSVEFYPRDVSNLLPPELR